MLMRCMMAVMLMLGTASLNTTYGQKNNPYHTSGESLMQQELWLHPDVLATKPDVPPQPGVGGATISVSELKIPERARKELERADKSLRSGNLREAAGHVEKGLAIYPQLPQAHNGLGALYAALKEYDKSVDEFGKALALNREYRLAADNLTAVLCLQHKYSEAEPVARRALEMDPGAASSQYLLGSVLVERGHTDEEATRLLQKAKDTYPRAWLFLAKVEFERGDLEGAAEDLRDYLRAPTTDRQFVQAWLEKIEKQIEAKKN
jgi:tetratricopeptide (TPR) repeat protein